MSSKTLLLQVFDWDRFSKNDALGEVKLGLGYFDLSRGLTEWRQLQSYSGKVRAGRGLPSQVSPRVFSCSALSHLSEHPQHCQQSLHILLTKKGLIDFLGRGENCARRSCRATEDQISNFLRQELSVTQGHRGAVSGQSESYHHHHTPPPFPHLKYLFRI